jgi:transcriptional regulator with XRE-family HTH domain
MVTLFHIMTQALSFRKSICENVPYTAGMPGGRPTTRQAPPFGSRLAAVRTARGMSQAGFAERVGLSREMVAYYERRARNPTADFVQRAAAVLGVSADELLGVEPLHKDRNKPGPPSGLDQRMEQVRNLPRSEQLYVIKFLDQVLAKHTS